MGWVYRCDPHPLRSAPQGDMLQRARGWRTCSSSVTANGLTLAFDENNQITPKVFSPIQAITVYRPLALTIEFQIGKFSSDFRT